MFATCIKDVMLYLLLVYKFLKGTNTEKSSVISDILYKTFVPILCLI